MKPRDQKPDKDYMITYENYRFPITDIRTMQKLLWDRKIQDERIIKDNSSIP